MTTSDFRKTENKINDGANAKGNSMHWALRLFDFLFKSSFAFDT